MELTKYTLMHKNIPTIDMFINDKSGYIEIVGTLVSAEHLPIGISCKNDIVNEEELNEWWSERCIPANREGFKQLFYSMNMNVRRNILTRCMGLSLIQPKAANAFIVIILLTAFPNIFLCARMNIDTGFRMCHFCNEAGD